MLGSSWLSGYDPPVTPSIIRQRPGIWAAWSFLHVTSRLPDGALITASPGLHLRIQDGGRTEGQGGLPSGRCRGLGHESRMCIRTCQPQSTMLIPTRNLRLSTAFCQLHPRKSSSYGSRTCGSSRSRPPSTSSVSSTAPTLEMPRF